jgi:hypothetical protein
MDQLSEDRAGNAAASGRVRIRYQAADSFFAVASLPYIPPARLSGYDMHCDQGLDHLLYLQTLIDEEMEH